MLELGIGMGLNSVLAAASNPATQFEGIDFNPLHIAHARGLAEAADLSNISLLEASFQDLAAVAQEGQHDLDLIVLHGILSWVSAEAHEAILTIVRRRLKPGGLLYVSYNCMPGWAPFLPMQRLMREVGKRNSGRSDKSVGAAIDLAQALAKEGALYFAANTGLAQRLERMASMDRGYLPHEYLNANWHIFHFADVAEMFGRAKLDFVSSATLVENADGLALPAGARTRIEAEADPIFKETLRDLASNKQFRRDLFGRGTGALTGQEQSALIAGTRFTLAVPRAKVTFTFPTLMGDLSGKAELYGPIADRLAQGPASFSEIAALPVFQAGGAGTVLQALTLLVHGGQVLPLPATPTMDFAPAQRLNSVLAEKMSQGRTYNFLAAPLAGSGVQATNLELLMLSALRAGTRETADTMSAALTERMQPLGLAFLTDGKPETEPRVIRARTEGEAHGFLTEKLPLWRQLGVI
ncbi:class I SAM-dependent methyltransferase [Methylobacterium radiodurans]|uniref:class I SAM-dependent methyltransferase n=1 Tax=Methylobacterium radiodurans TaxID=2202828 RepID=UPI0013A5981D|nr:class I SAM-dependent methyltransferase [Methylobacterium radiodurans]